MKNTFAQICKFSALLAMMAGPHFAVADQAPNPRSASIVNAASGRGESAVVKRGAGTNANVANGTARSAIRRPSAVVSRNVSADKKKTARSTMNSRSAMPAMMRSADVARSATSTNVSRAGVLPTGSSRARNAVNAVSGLTRAASKARATAVFTDISKIGGGYAACREAYATCMDQFCANANDTFRRCYCSSRFVEFRDAELAMDEAKVLLQKFEDNNLNAVDKTAEEVDAMYSASIGEAAIKNDTSGAQSILNEIGDLLSGKKKASSNNNNTNSLGIMSLDFSTDMDDVWGSSGGGSLFDTDSGVDLTKLEGQDLFNASNKQCVQMIKESCESAPVLNMATSAYNIMITQDCNLYEKKVNQKREQVMQTVRQAEKILRDARLEEYRAHNSKDVNECITKVQSAMLSEVACGPNYERCMDYSGAYINSSTGEPIYSPRLFELTNIITLSGAGGNMDVLGQNPKFNEFLESKKMYAETALDSCRSISDTVWTEFKRMALIQIAQAQDEKIESVKMSCVNTMKECYDTQSNALKSFDNTTAKSSGAISAYAAKSMCQDKVIACASLYGDTTGCQFDGNGRLTKGNAADGSARCGLTALLSFVDNVDDARVAEGCEIAIEKQLQEWCTPVEGTQGAYPWQCRLRGLNELAIDIYTFAHKNCSDPSNKKSMPELDPNATLAVYRGAMRDILPLDTLNKISQSINEIQWQLESQFIDKCEELNGYWIDTDSTSEYANASDLLAFYTAVYGKGSSSTTKGAQQWGRCVENSTRVACLAYNSSEDDKGADVMAKYDIAKDECVFSDKWYEQQCYVLGGYFDGSNCYVGK